MTCHAFELGARGRSLVGRSFETQSGIKGQLPRMGKGCPIGVEGIAVNVEVELVPSGEAHTLRAAITDLAHGLPRMIDLFVIQAMDVGGDEETGLGDTHHMPGFRSDADRRYPPPARNLVQFRDPGALFRDDLVIGFLDLLDPFRIKSRFFQNAADECEAAIGRQGAPPDLRWGWGLPPGQGRS